ncbi:MAG: hypothetical protein IT338_03960 [Thermomicrobiales bacterium]|nr:hypothetical protein [Thermomicrobiales bacterium]
MIYRILTSAPDRYWSLERGEYVNEASPLLGAGTTLGGVMWALHLPAPDIANPRARFWFTERGWDRVGREVAAEARRRGHVVKVIRRKNPRPSQIVFADEWQVALLPETARRQTG